MKIKLLLSFLIMLMFTSCSNDNNTTIKTDKSKEVERNTPPCYWVCNDIIHYKSSDTTDTVLYSGPLGEFDDEGVFDGYELKGELHLYDTSVGFKYEELETFGYKTGMEVHYNSEKDSYILCYEMGIYISEAYEHKCGEHCIDAKKYRD